MTTVHFVYVTTPDAACAGSIGRALVEERLAACANLLDGVTSIYRWEGTLQQDRECVLVLKTTAARLDALTRRVTELHPYELPCVVALPVASGHPPFLEWVASETA